MAAKLDYYLKSLESSYYLKNNSDEVTRINNSISTLEINLSNHFGSKIKRKFIFGSYDRDTILPRKYDAHSDVDYMVVFNHTEYEREPETFRSWLKNFADKYYTDRYGTKVEKTFPTVSVLLNNISYDLVPAKEEQVLWSTSTTIYIPGNQGWRSTDPNDVKQKLITANTSYNGVVRPIIRLFKAWNSYVGYPYDSYLLELLLTGMNFNGDTVETGFYYAINQLQTSILDPQLKTTKIESLKYNIGKVKDCLAADNLESAKNWLHRVLPNPNA